MNLRNGHSRPTTPSKAIKEFCLECVGWNKKDVKTCPSKICPLWDYRTGHYKPALDDDESLAKDGLEEVEEIEEFEEENILE